MEPYHIRSHAVGGAESCYSGIGDAAIYLVSHDFLEEKIQISNHMTLVLGSISFLFGFISFSLSSSATRPLPPPPPPPPPYLLLHILHLHTSSFISSSSTASSAASSTPPLPPPPPHVLFHLIIFFLLMTPRRPLALPSPSCLPPSLFLHRHSRRVRCSASCPTSKWSSVLGGWLACISESSCQHYLCFLSAPFFHVFNFPLLWVSSPSSLLSFLSFFFSFFLHRCSDSGLGCVTASGMYVATCRR